MTARSAESAVADAALSHSATDTPVDSARDRLPTTVFERFVLNSEDHAHRMNMRVVLRLTGQVHHTELQESWDIAVSRHPMLMSRVDYSDAMPRWVRTEPPALEMTTCDREIETIETGDIGPSRLAHRSGLRGEALVGSDGLLVKLDFHHACSDGTGMRQFISDWMHLYDCQVRGLSSRLQPYEADRLAARGEWMPPAGDHAETVGGLEAIRNFLLTVRGRTMRLNPQRASTAGSTTDSASPRTYCVESRIESADFLSGEPAPDLRRSLKRFDITLNDLLLACCMKAADSLQNNQRLSQRITVLTPVDLRRPSDRFLSACNRFGVVFLRRRRSECRDSMSLVRGLHDEMSYIKSKNVAVEFLKGLQQLEKLPAASSLMRRLGWFVPTMQLTYLGDITRVPGRLLRSNDDGWPLPGDLRFESATGIPPLPPGANLAVAACLTGPRLTLGIRAAAEAFSMAATEQFAEELHRQAADLCRKLAEERPSRLNQAEPI